MQKRLQKHCAVGTYFAGWRPGMPSIECFERVWEGFLGVFWEGLGRVLEGFWKGFGRVLGGFWEGFGRVWGWFWDGFGIVLGWFWDSRIETKRRASTSRGCWYQDPPRVRAARLETPESRLEKPKTQESHQKKPNPCRKYAIPDKESNPANEHNRVHAIRGELEPSETR